MHSDDETGFKRLGDVSTCMTDMNALRQADEPKLAHDAQARLLTRYRGPILQYLRHEMPDVGDAETVFQDFAVHFLEGRFRGFDPGRGRFREYLKRSLRNLVRDHHRKRPPYIALPPDLSDPTTRDDPGRIERKAFSDFVRSDILHRAFASLDEAERAQPSSMLSTALRLRIQDDSLTSADIASIITSRTGRRTTEESVRKAIYKSRQHLWTSIINQIRSTLENPTFNNIEQEVIDLGLHSLFRKPSFSSREPSVKNKHESKSDNPPQTPTRNDPGNEALGLQS